MNIKNKPAIQMDQKDQTIVSIQREIEVLKKQNVFLREQYQRVSKGLPLKIPEFGRMMGRTAQNEMSGSQVSRSGHLPPIEKESMTPHNEGKNKDPASAIILDYNIKF